MSAGYEFNDNENELIGSLAGKMGVVGLVNVLVGILYFLSAVVVLAIIFQDKLPAEVTSKVPEDIQSKIPENKFLWGIVIQQGVAGLIFLLIGVWTRSAATSFREIVDTSGQDISHLMNALRSLHKMYALIYTIIVLTLVLSLVGLGLQLYLKYGG